MADFASIRFLPSRPLLRELSADRLNSILAEIRRNKPLPGRGVTVRQTGQGTAIDLAASIPRGGPAIQVPFDILVKSKEEETYTLQVVPGIVSGILPSNWDAEFPAGEGELYYGKAVCTTDGRYVTGVSLVVDTEAPISQEPQLFAIEETVELLFGIFQDGIAHNVTGGKLAPTAKIAMSAPNAEGGPLDPPLNAYYVLL